MRIAVKLWVNDEKNSIEWSLALKIGRIPLQTEKPTKT
jgi:hypothetical protein